MIAQIGSRPLPRIMLAIVLACAMNFVHANDQLYRAEVAVAGDAGGDRAAAFREALQRVIVKLTGRQDVAANAVLQEALNQPREYVRGFGFVDREDAQGQRRRMLGVDFSPQALNRLLQRAQVPVWGSERPDVMIWMAIEQNGQRDMIGQDRPEWAQPLVTTLRERGLRAFFPLLDLEERRMAPMSELWGGYTEGIVNVAERYGADTFLVARVSDSSIGDFTVRWLLHDHGEEQFWRSGPHNSLEEATHTGANEMADRLAARYAVVGGGENAGAQRVLIENIAAPDDYARALRYLGGLSLIDSVAVVAARGSALELEVVTGGASSQQLIDTVRLGRVLELSSDLARPGIIVFRILP